MKLKYHFLSGLILACGLGIDSYREDVSSNTRSDS